MTEPKPMPAEMPKQVPVDMKKEMEAITGSLKLLDVLSPEGQHRAFSYIGNVLGLSAMIAVRSSDKASASRPTNIAPHGVPGAGNITYGSLSELYNAARPKTEWQKVIVGGYWFQVCNQQEEFGALAVNDGLKEIGAKVSNVTVAFNAAKEANPSLVLQVRKSGKAQQARKLYKLTVAGIRAVEEMISREE
jgi:hypothetical protein